MGDRNNPIKFGPEWLRNISRDRSTGGATNSQNVNPGPSTTATSGQSGASAGATATNATATTASNTNNTSKVHLAKLRYGREEMLALYDRNSEAPVELKNIEALYQPRGKQPVALNNTFDDDRDNMRNAQPISLASGERFSMGRGIVRGSANDGRGRPRGSYVRQPSTSRGGNWHMGSPKMPNYSGGPDDDGGSRSWTNTNANNSNRNSGDQTDWNNKMYRNKRQGTNTNWRQQHTRDDGEEWRSSETGRPRHVDKWDRDSGEKSTGDKPHSWNSNRRTWGGDMQHNEENLPEWVSENAECGGTFDSSGAFHGYSNDDSNLPKQDSSNPLARSHTHGSFPRPKAPEEGSEEWWASEKAKKLSPIRFDASDLKYRKQAQSALAALNPRASSKSSSGKEEPPMEVPEKLEAPAAGPDVPERDTAGQEEATDERGNFQSVIINANNSLRQKHQHLVPAMHEASGVQMANLKVSMDNDKPELDHVSQKAHEDMLVDNLFGMSLEENKEMLSPSSNSLMTYTNTGLSAGLASAASALPQNPNMQMHMSVSSLPNQGMSMDLHLNKQSIQTAVVPPVHQSPGLQTGVMNSQGMPGRMQPGMPGCLQINPSMPPPNIQTSGMPNPGYPMQNPAMPSGGMQNMQGLMQAGRVHTQGMPPVMQSVGITNNALNASLGLPIGPNMGMPLQGMPQQGMQQGLPQVMQQQGMQQQVMPNVCMANNSSMGGPSMSVMGGVPMQSGGIPGFPSNNPMPGMSNNVGNSSLFLGQNSNNQSLSSNDHHSGQNNMFLHGLQHSGSQAPFGNSMYTGTKGNLAEQWYYEDPERNIQGPFTSKEMFNWYKAGFFSPSLMVRRGCETMMRPLGTYGPMVPFAQMDILPYPMSSGFDGPQGNHENLLGPQSSLGLDVDNLWGQTSGSADMMWMQQHHMGRPEARVNNLPIFFWEQQPSAINSNSLLPEEIAKEMKTEDQILAQLRATQNLGQPSQGFLAELQGSSVVSKPDDCYAQTVNATPNLEELHKLIQKETLTGQVTSGEVEQADVQPKLENPAKIDKSSSDISVPKSVPQTKTAEPKQPKPPKENDKSSKNKENNNTKNKNKKAKEDKKEETPDVKTKEDEVIKSEKRSQDPSPPKNKKEDKMNKKELEKEKKEWIKEGFTIVKGSEKSSSKDNKKKAEEARVAEEAERKRKEEEKLAAEEEKKKKQAETVKKQQEQHIQQQQQQQRHATESVAKKAPWSAVANQAMQATSQEGPTLAEIQRLEREKKLEQMKEQQQMMQIIAQQQAAALARDQEMQAGLGWAKKKGSNQSQGQSLPNIQAEARKQAVAVAVAAAKVAEEAEAPARPQITHAPWANTHNGGGFWDTQPNSTKQDKQEPQKPVEQVKNKKKATPTITNPTVKKDATPAVEFEAWCTTVLTSWSAKIDVPTFVGFLKDIESPYEVKDYVKCYLGESKDSNDFARQFLERRSKLLRVGMVTPSDDLCSPAMAVNPRTTSGSDYQEVKGKGKKTKKNKMLKVDARILGFSVTAAEDRINVGDIDTA